MNIKSRLKIIIFFIFLITILFIISIYALLQNYETSVDKTATLSQIVGLFSIAASLFFILLLGSFSIIWRGATRLSAANLNLQGVDRLKDEFVSTASHELLTPMTAIKDLVSMIFEGDFGIMPEGLRPPLTDIATSTNRLIILVNDLLDLARIEAGKTKFNLSDIQLDTTIHQVISQLQPLTWHKGIVLKAENIPNVFVQADVDKLQEIINNVLGNAIKFTNQGSIVISAKQDSTAVRIFFSDTGIGISPENQAELFGKFQQVSSQKEGRPLGTGLGLYISRELARKMGGDLWVEKSELGHGTTFGLSILLAKSNEAETIKEALAKEEKLNSD